MKILKAIAALLYKMGVSFRHNLFDWGVLKGIKFDIPIICIGNITVGGTGKTPMSEVIISHLSKSYNVCLLSRGYGRRTKGYLEVSLDSHYRDVGDEPLQIKRKFPNALVVVCEKRVDAIRRIQSQHPDVNLIIMDDGFQHRYVIPKINIIMVDATRPIQDDYMLPLGSLRDNFDQLHRANFFVVTKCPLEMTPLDRRIMKKVLIQLAYQKIYFTRFESFTPKPIYTDIEPIAISKSTKVIAMSGIGNPAPFVDELSNRYNVIDALNYNDHHVYMKSDIKLLAEKIKNDPDAIVVMTEKDAVKLSNRSKIPAELQQRLYYLPINISFTEDSSIDFLQKLESDVKSN